MKYIILLLLIITNSHALRAPLSDSTMLSGKKVTSLGTSDKKTVVFFLSASCPCTKKNIPYLQSLSSEYPDFQFLGVHSSANESMEDAKKEFGNLKFPIAYDKDMKIADQFKATKTPHVFVLDEESEILFHGGVTNSVDPVRAKNFYLKNALEDISGGKEVRQKFAKALGCYIVR